MNQDYVSKKYIIISTYSIIKSKVKKIIKT